MKDFLPFIEVYLVIINIFAFIIYGIDKNKAKRHQYRISEGFLIFIAAIGGSLGAVMAMIFFSHKTKHRKFTVTVPVLLAVHTAMFCLLIR